MPDESPSVFDRPLSITPGTLERLGERITPRTDETIPVTAPVTGETVGHIPDQTPAQVGAVVDEARDAQADWASTPVDERAAVVRRFTDLVLDERRRLVDIIQLETGKSRIDALEEPLDSVVSGRYYAKRGASMLADTRRRGVVPLVTKAIERRRARGVVGAITPWNYPMAIPFDDVLPALLAGNAVVMKPDEQTPYTALYAAELLDRAGLPEGVFRIVTGDGPTVGGALIDDVDFVAFTGSLEVGRLVGARAGKRLIECSLELGGKNPCIVLDDADPRPAASGTADACFANAGQLCLSTERLFVEEAIADEFVDAFVAATRPRSFTTSFDFDGRVGSLISPDHLEVVEGYVDDAVDAGASVLTGGRARPDLGPAYFEPTILTDVPEDAALATEEVFGPVVAIETVDDEAAAVERANRIAPSLHAVVWSGEAGHGESVANRLDAGMVSVNDPYYASYGSVDVPMGGATRGGIGHRQGRPGLGRYTERQSVVVQRGRSLSAPDWLPLRGYAHGLVWLTRLLTRLPRR